MERTPRVYKNNKEALPHHVYILGHSLDITDKDILSRLIAMEGTITTIFYHNQEAFGNQIRQALPCFGERENRHRAGLLHWRPERGCRFKICGGDRDPFLPGIAAVRRGGLQDQAHPL